MTSIFIVSVVFSIVVSGFCSLMEAALYAVPLPYVKNRKTEGFKTGELLLEFKENIGKPIAGILIVNTIANTAGASVAGWAASEAFGAEYLLLFSACFTLAILYMSEIIPKQMGVVYCKEVSSFIAYPLKLITVAVAPLIFVSEQMSRWIKSDGPSLSHQEILSVAEIGTEEGALDHFEGSVITNVIGLDELLVKDVLTPRIVVFRKQDTASLGEIKDELHEWNFTRVPLYSDEAPDNLDLYVTQRDIYRALMKEELSATLKEFARPLKTIPELMRVDQALLTMFEEHEHMFSVVDEHGGLAGIITLEDIIEEIIGREIVDEYDTVSDLRTFAKLLRLTRHRKKEKNTSQK